MDTDCTRKNAEYPEFSQFPFPYFCNRIKLKVEVNFYTIFSHKFPKALVSFYIVAELPNFSIPVYQ